jgi:hypothetical protein
MKLNGETAHVSKYEDGDPMEALVDSDDDSGVKETEDRGIGFIQ